MTLPDRSWMDRAECRRRGLPTEVFFPESRDLVPIEVAECCSACPVLEECLEYGLETDAYGVWALTSERDRDRIRRRRRRRVA